MNKHLVAAFAITLAVFFSTTVVLAFDNPGLGASNTGGLNNIGGKFQQNREEVREKMASKTAELREKRRGIVKEILGKLISFLSNTETRLNNISGKIQGRIDKAKARGVDVSKFQTALDSCRQNKASAETAIAAAKAKVNAIDTNNLNDGAIKDARAAILAARRELNSYRQCLVDVMRQIRLSKELREGSESAK
ncbi:hypothetical protein HY024_02600 [Candidatus Curtissbacteria bacterium]|nr:hypothetical protein [Candidatus Curtissbacteria bacterium]